MTAITPARSPMQQEETAYRSAVSESLLTKIGANINYLDTVLGELSTDVADIVSSINIEKITVSHTGNGSNVAPVTLISSVAANEIYIRVDVVKTGGITTVNYDWSNGFNTYTQSLGSGTASPEVIVNGGYLKYAIVDSSESITFYYAKITLV